MLESTIQILKWVHSYYLLLLRGVRTSIRDGGGLTALERAMELGAITDEELFILLYGNDWCTQPYSSELAIGMSLFTPFSSYGVTLNHLL